MRRAGTDARNTVMISAYMTDTVTRRAFGGLDSYNERQSSTTSTHAAQVVWKTQIVRDQDGSEVTAAGHINTKTAYAYGDEVVINGRAHAVAAIEDLRVFGQTEGYRVWFK